MFLSQIPTPAPGSIEAWLIPAAAVLSLVALGRKVFSRKPNGRGGPEQESPAPPAFASRPELDRELNAVRDKIDARFFTLGEKIETLGNSINERLAKLEATVARLDERTKL
jgi:hypothetical protein